MGSLRSRPRQSVPTVPLAGFPTSPIHSTLWRASRRPDPWWYGNARADGAEPNRFDREAGGVCYTAARAEAAALELFGTDDLPAGLDASELDGVVIHGARVEGHEPCADLMAPRAASYGVTGELSTGIDYATCAHWAQALTDEGFRALRYRLRFGQGEGFALLSDAVGAVAVTPTTRRSIVKVLEHLGVPVRDFTAERVRTVEPGTDGS